MNTENAPLKLLYEQILRGDIRSEFDKLGFWNIGYWKGVEDSVEIAQINLIETLIKFLCKREGSILDVACGKGVSTKFLTKYFDPKNITGVNISEAQLGACAIIAPECNFRLMDATKLEFADGSVDNILCIEAAQHFRTRRKFLERAYRVLSPEGRLAMHDVVFHNAGACEELDPEIWPKDNYMPDLKIYRSMMLEIGFRHVRVEDITESSMVAAARCLIKKKEQEFAYKRDYRLLAQAVSEFGESSPWMPGNCSWCMVYAIR
jgi:MPBQ/MSBQ methyltransferase